jgi:hypothetical protein
MVGTGYRGYGGVSDRLRTRNLFHLLYVLHTSYRLAIARPGDAVACSNCIYPH